MNEIAVRRNLPPTVACPSCGVLELAARQVWVVLSGTEVHCFVFRCPGCASVVRFEAGQSSGARPVRNDDGCDAVPPGGTAA